MELSALVEAVQRGEDVLIGKAGKPVARLIVYRGAAARRQPGALKGKIKIHADFNTLPPDIAEAFGV